VELLGYVDDIHSLYIKCDCFVLPSQTEGMPIALLEAMASSTPIVVTSVGSVPKVVTHMLDALVIPPNNEDSLYKALRHLLGDPLLLKRIGCNARKKFLQKYTSGIMTDKYISVYKNIVSSG
ncbi:MAG: glycosyltransferase family 4 protein, partial [Thermotogota bacterium]|nr:glycosyltransferase family 4 protein [Thermotogota bacterium]